LGRPGAVADDECDGEVGLVQSSEEASANKAALAAAEPPFLRV
jgi:hypothetical protein